MNSEKLQRIIEILTFETKQKLFIKELKSTTVHEIIAQLTEISQDLDSSNYLENYRISEELHQFFKEKYENALKAIDFLEAELEELKVQQRKSLQIVEKSFETRENPAEFPAFRSQTAQFHEKIKRECEENRFSVDEVRVISKSEENELRQKFDDCEARLRDFERRNREFCEDLRVSEEKVRTFQEKVAKLVQENQLLNEKVQLLLENNGNLCQENRDLKEIARNLTEKLAIFEKKNLSISSKNAGLSTRILTMSQEMEQIRLEKSEMQEDFLQKLNVLRSSLEKSSINDRFREVLVKSQDFCAFFREFPHKKAVSVDNLPEKSDESAEKLTFRRTKQIPAFSPEKQENSSKKYSKLNKYQTEFGFYDNHQLLEEILSEKDSRSSQKVKRNRSETAIVDYFSEGNEQSAEISRKKSEKVAKVAKIAKIPGKFASAMRNSKKLFVCPAIFPNDDVKFVAKRRKTLTDARTSVKREEFIANRQKVEIRSCDPCRIF